VYAGDHKRETWTLKICFVLNQVYVSICLVIAPTLAKKNMNFHVRGKETIGRLPCSKRKCLCMYKYSQQNVRGDPYRPLIFSHCVSHILTLALLKQILLLVLSFFLFFFLSFFSSFFSSFFLFFLYFFLSFFLYFFRSFIFSLTHGVYFDTANMREYMASNGRMIGA